jgi:hypothetical protein
MQFNFNVTGIPFGEHRLNITPNVQGHFALENGTMADFILEKTVSVKFSVRSNPIITFPSLQKNATFTNSSVPLNFTVDHPVSKMSYCLDGQDSVPISGNTTLTGLSDGYHNVSFYATDAFGNVGASETIYFTVDTVPPNVSILSPTSSTYDTTEIQLNLTVNEPVSKLEYSLYGQANVTITGNTTLTEISYGSHSLTVYCYDTAGNVGNKTITFTTLPLMPMAVAIVSVAVVGVSLLVYFKKRKQKTER